MSITTQAASSVALTAALPRETSCCRRFYNAVVDFVKAIWQRIKNLFTCCCQDRPTMTQSVSTTTASTTQTTATTATTAAITRRAPSFTDRESIARHYFRNAYNPNVDNLQIEELTYPTIEIRLTLNGDESNPRLISRTNNRGEYDAIMDLLRQESTTTAAATSTTPSAMDRLSATIARIRTANLQSASEGDSLSLSPPASPLTPPYNYDNVHDDDDYAEPSDTSLYALSGAPYASSAASAAAEYQEAHPHVSVVTLSDGRTSYDYSSLPLFSYPPAASAASPFVSMFASETSNSANAAPFSSSLTSTYGASAASAASSSATSTTEYVEDLEIPEKLDGKKADGTNLVHDDLLNPIKELLPDNAKDLMVARLTDGTNITGYRVRYTKSGNQSHKDFIDDRQLIEAALNSIVSRNATSFSYELGDIRSQIFKKSAALLLPGTNNTEQYLIQELREFLARKDTSWKLKDNSSLIQIYYESDITISNRVLVLDLCANKAAEFTTDDTFMQALKKV